MIYNYSIAAELVAHLIVALIMLAPVIASNYIIQKKEQEQRELILYHSKWAEIMKKGGFKIDRPSICGKDINVRTQMMNRRGKNGKDEN